MRAPAPEIRRSGIVLAGGRSSRIGRPKALLEIAGEPLLARVVARLALECADIVVVAAPPGTRPDAETGAIARLLERLATGASGSGGEETAAGVRLVHDATADRGPVAGLAAGLAAARGAHAFVAACDAPFLATSLVAGLFAIAEAEPELDLVIPRTAGGLEPLTAVYRVATGASHYAAQLAEGDLRPTSRLARLRVREVGGAALAGLDPFFDSFVGVNDADQYRAAQGRAAALSGPPRRPPSPR